MSAAPEVWIVDDDRSIRWVLARALAAEGLRVSEFETGEAALAALDARAPGAILTDIRMPGADGVALLEKASARPGGPPVIVMTAYSDLESAVSAFRAGAFEYLPKPFDLDEAVALVRRALRAAASEGEARTPEPAPEAPEILGSAPAMQEVFKVIGRLSRSHLTVLITGESGTGKELVARALHRHSPRARAPFIALNAAAIPGELLESELFGHERGAFTGAQAQRRGRFEQADGGTLFLDEIGDMPNALQTRLLRVLATGEFYRVGGHTPVVVDVRVIAATHQPLEEKVREGKFREDLWHRLNVIRLHMPRLSERREDIGLLARSFLAAAAAELGVAPKTLSVAAEQHLARLDWPGNVRQLHNLCRWLTVMASGGEIHVADLPEDVRGAPARAAADWASELERWADTELATGRTNLLAGALPRFERVMILAALKRAGGKRQEAAKLLGWGRNTLTRKMRSYVMD